MSTNLFPLSSCGQQSDQGLRDSSTTRNDGRVINELVGTELQHEQSADKGSDIEGDDIPVGHCSSAWTADHRLWVRTCQRSTRRAANSRESEIYRISEFIQGLAVRPVQKPGVGTEPPRQLVPSRLICDTQLPSTGRGPPQGFSIFSLPVGSIFTFAILSSCSLWLEFG